LYSSPDILRIIKPKRMRGPGPVSCMREKNAYTVLVGNPDGNRQLGIPRLRWEANIKTDLRGICWVGMNWIILAENMEQ
jgi:hypothetical protein